MKILIKRIRLQIEYLLGIKPRPKTCKYCGTVTNYSKKYGPSYFTPPGAKPCTICSEHVTIAKDRNRRW